MHNYHDVNRHFPRRSSSGPMARRRTVGASSCFPFLDTARPLYEQYRINEPSDSPDNKQVSNTNPKLSTAPTTIGNRPTADIICRGTRHRRRPRIRDITDGTSKTIMIVEAERTFLGRNPKTFRSIPTSRRRLSGDLFRENSPSPCATIVPTLQKGEVKDYLKWLIIRNDGKPIGSTSSGRIRYSNRAFPPARSASLQRAAE